MWNLHNGINYLLIKGISDKKFLAISLNENGSYIAVADENH